MALLDFAKFAFNRFASVVDFDNTGTDIVGDKVQTALVELANRHYGKNFARVIDLTTDLTDLGVYQNKVTLDLNNLPAGLYRVGWTFTVFSDKNNTISKGRIILDQTTELATLEAGQIPASIMDWTYVNLTNADHDLDIEWKVDAGNGNALISDAKIEFWRVS